MNINTGEIVADIGKIHYEGTSRSGQRNGQKRQVRTAKAVVEQIWKPIDPANLSAANQKQLAETGRTQISRNSACPCGSRKRFKKCCYTGPETS